MLRGTFLFGWRPYQLVFQGELALRGSRAQDAQWLCGVDVASRLG